MLQRKVQEEKKSYADIVSGCLIILAEAASVASCANLKHQTEE